MTGNISDIQITNLRMVDVALIYPVAMSTRALFVVSLLMILAVTRVDAQTGENVLLVENEMSADSKEITARYAAARAIPAANIVRLRTQVSDDVERRAFDAEIERPIAQFLVRNNAQDRILYIVLTKGIPLRVRGTGGITGTVASVDSELTVLYRKLLGQSVLPAGRIDNPYFSGNREQAEPFSHRNHDIYLVTRLDGFSVADVMGLIERGSRPARAGAIVLDQKATRLGSQQGDAWLAEAGKRLSSAGFGDRVTMESTTAVASGVKQVLGYYSWGSNDPANTRRRFDFGFVPGALAATFVSTDARTLSEPPAEWTIGSWQDPKTHFAGSPQSLVGDLIREGVTGVSGHVAEPYLDGTTRPQILFPRYVAGANLAEAYYQAIPFLSWQNVVIGDPLCAPFRTAQLQAEEVSPPADPETDLPRYFSIRRLAMLTGFGVKPETAKLLLKAQARLMVGDINGARQALENVTRIEPTLNAAHFVLAGLYERDREFDRAIERYNTILKNREDDVRALNNLAYILAVEKKDLQQALALSERAYNLASDRRVTLDLGYSLITPRGAAAGALPFSELNPRLVLAQIADTLGWTYHLLGNQAEAERYLREALKGAPGSAEIQLHIAMFEGSRGHQTEALSALAAALKIDSGLEDSPEVKQLKASLERKSP